MKKPLKNALGAFAANVVAVLVGFVAQKIFISTLGIEFLGLNSLFTNIIAMLGIAELGIGSAIVYNLYTPMKRGDHETVAALARFYRNTYRTIAMAIMIVGLIITPFLSFFISGATPDTNIYIAFLLVLIDTVCSYLLIYRRNILYAAQDGYLISAVHIGYLLVTNALQIILLLLTRNYYLYLAIKILTRIAENLAIHFIAYSKYPYLANAPQKQLPQKIRGDIFIKTKALIFHRFAGFVVSGTDNIVISVFLGLTTVGLYSNYAMITSALITIFAQAITALTPSVGHLLVDKNIEKNFAAFRKVRQTTFLIALSTSICLLALATPFVKVWLGESYVLPSAILLALTVNYFQQLMRASFMTFKEAAGIYHEDRFVPFVESVINIIASVVLVQFIGLPGVIIGTILSSLVLWCFSYPKFVYKPLFGRSYRQYALETGAYFAIFAIIITLIYLIIS